MVTTIDTIWSDTLAYLKERVPRQVFETWFSPAQLESLEDGSARITVPNRFFGDWLGEHYGELLGEALSVAKGGGRVDVSFVVGDRTKAPLRTQPDMAGAGRPSPVSRSRRNPNLNPKYTFGTFVVGGSNQFAHAASMAVAEQPARAYNPLFIYGGVGLGKTHLLNAIGNHVAERTELRIAYVTTEQFTNEVINSIRYDKMIDLRRRYRNVDMLMIDDIQFLAGKERTQEEFFHTFNALYEAHKQIVVSSDRFPKEMPDIDERLRSRFEWGLIADLQSPDVETRIAILRKKSEDEGVHLPEDVVQFLAANMKSNIRELEGSLVRLGAYSSLTGQLITLDMAKTVLRDVIGDKKKIVAMDDIQEAVSTRFHLKVSDLKSRRRSKTLVHPRQIAMFLCRELTDASFPEIGRQFGGKDHTTIMHACKQVAKALEADTTLRATLEGLKEQIVRG
ncbi:chromosomal replication initiator protein DnaA [Nitrospira sp.]|nr:chromosomal replication initiator protein DnaA [Nitrospira sp.]